MEKFLYFLIVFFISACNNSHNSNDDDVNNIKTIKNIKLDATSVYEHKGLSMELSIEENNDQLRLSIDNNSNNDIALVNPWRLFYLKDGNWQLCKYKVGFFDIFESILQNNKYETVIELDQFEDSLYPGLYKLEQTIGVYNSLVERKVLNRSDLINYFRILDEREILE